HLSARETAELRRWILGAEGGRQSRARGLKRRLEDLIAGDDKAEKLLQDITHHTKALIAPGWAARIKDSNPQGPAEKFLALVYQQVFARSDDRNSSYSLEAATRPLIVGLPE